MHDGGGGRAHLTHGHASAADSRVPVQPAGQAAHRAGRAAARQAGEPAPAPGHGHPVPVPEVMRLLAGLTDQREAVRFGADALSTERLLACAAAVADDVADAPVVAVSATPALETVVAMVGALRRARRSCRCRRTPARRTGAHPARLRRRPHGDGGPAPHRRRNLSGARRRAGRADHVHQRDDRPAEGRVLSHGRDRRRSRRARRRVGVDGRTTCWCTGCRCSTCTVWCSACSAPLRVGCRLVHTGRPTPEAYAAAGGTLYFGVPTVWSRIAAPTRRRPRAAPAPGCWSPAARRCRRRSSRGCARSPGTGPVERYGMTETLITISARADGAAPRRAGSACRCAGVEHPAGRRRRRPAAGRRRSHRRAADPRADAVRRLPAPAGRDAPRSPPTAGSAPATSPTVDADGGTASSAGPATDLIKSGGYRIGAGEVEDALLAHPAVREAAVVGAPHDDLGQQIVAYVVADGVADGRAHRVRGQRCRRTSARAESGSSRRCRATRWARSRSGCS